MRLRTVDGGGTATALLAHSRSSHDTSMLAGVTLIVDHNRQVSCTVRGSARLNIATVRLLDDRRNRIGLGPTRIRGGLTR